MARNPPTRPRRDEFARLLTWHVRTGTRAATTATEPWSYAALAREVSSSRDNEFVSDRTISNWCNGSSLPEQIGSLLDVLFGTNTRHAEARAALRAAFDDARLEKSIETAARQEQSRAGSIFAKAPDPDQPGELVLAINRTARATDQRAATDPVQHQMQLRLHGMAADLASAAARLKNSLTWARLHETARDYARLLDGEAGAVVSHLGDLYALALQAGVFLETDDEVRGDPNSSADPLAPDIRGLLRPLVQVGAPWLRGFPSIAAMDDQAGKLLMRDAGIVGRARHFVSEAASARVISARDATELDILGQAAEGPGFLAEKAGGRAVSGARNLLFAAGHLLAAAAAGAVPANATSVVALARRATDLLDTNDLDVAALTKGQGDIGPSLRFLAQHGAAVGERIRKFPSPPLSPIAVPEDVEERARQMILRGEAPPEAWRPFVRELDFHGTDLRNLRPLLGLTALQRLGITRTEVSNIAPLAGLTALQTLSLDRTNVADLRPLRGLIALQHLYLLRTTITDISPLAGLFALRDLVMMETYVSDIAPLAKLTALELLILDDTDVSDIRPLVGLTALQHLNLGGTKVSDVRPLARLSNLKELHLTGTLITDVSPLAGLKALQKLSLLGTDLCDVTPLAHLTELRLLWLPDTVTDLSSLVHLQELEIVDQGGKRRQAQT